MRESERRERCERVKEGEHYALEPFLPDRPQNEVNVGSKGCSLIRFTRHKKRQVNVSLKQRTDQNGRLKLQALVYDVFGGRCRKARLRVGVRFSRLCPFGSSATV